METRIIGTVMPVLEVGLEPGESVVAEAGQLSWMTDSIRLHTSSAVGGGMFRAVKRAFGGGGFFMTEYGADLHPGIVAFAAKLPGQVVPITVRPGEDYLVHRHGFLCGTADIGVSTSFQRRLGAGIFGGAGFTLQKVTGAGYAWVELSGEVVHYDLAPGETLRVHPGHIGMFEARVDFDITLMRGIRNILFGGDGLFLATLTGPGRVWLQSLTISNLAQALLPYLPLPERNGQ
ncbi:TIGR00266 family protein [Nocardia sp. CDC159]|uniref:TIGR00266 family protein n=1 Tax=Nocardia pulmonis TaxID=2951408 RepID=A0A9X2IVX0_9NOCA|nr:MULTISPECIES: TIGR00266 family protein [Nocardia]MCM6773663.1 TIGR00266 family protein [Nocardia pulmonis]MCM6786550.1 TIGR00266 family protein [Nocardia sp. CDC159]